MVDTTQTASVSWREGAQHPPSFDSGSGTWTFGHCEGTECCNFMARRPSDMRKTKGGGWFCEMACYRGKAQREAGRASGGWHKGLRLSAYSLAHCQGTDCCNFVCRRTSEVRGEVYCSRWCYRRGGGGASGGRKGGRKRDVSLSTGEHLVPGVTTRIDNRGYMLVWLGRGIGPYGGWHSEHRYVMEQSLGRTLLPGENVHHRNGVKTDNRLSNLELWVVSQPKGQRVEDVVEWATEILGRYAPQLLASTRVD